MNRILLAAVGLLALGAAPALAADLPVKAKPVPVTPVWNWSGFYLGFNGGGAQSHDCWNISTPVAIGDGCHDAAGGVVGGQIGYRWQWAPTWVFGLEAQGDWAGLKGRSVSVLGAPIFPAGVVVDNQTRIDGLGLFTGQIGYSFNGWATNSMLVYLKGGAAVADYKFNGTDLALLTNLDGAHATRWGGAVGAGIEFGLAPGWSVGIEYDHLFMGSSATSFTYTTSAAPLVGVSRSASVSGDIDMLTARLNYTFNWGGPVVARY